MLPTLTTKTKRHLSLFLLLCLKAVTILALTVSTDATWSGDQTLNENLEIDGATLVVEGNLTINGSLFLKSSGDTLIVEGDLTINGDNETMLEGNTILIVHGNFTTSHKLTIKEGGRMGVRGDYYQSGDELLEIKGDLYVGGDFTYDSSSNVGKVVTDGNLIIGGSNVTINPNINPEDPANEAIYIISDPVTITGEIDGNDCSSGCSYGDEDDLNNNEDQGLLDFIDLVNPPVFPCPVTGSIFHVSNMWSL